MQNKSWWSTDWFITPPNKMKVSQSLIEYYAQWSHSHARVQQCHNSGCWLDNAIQSLCFWQWPTKAACSAVHLLYCVHDVVLSSYLAHLPTYRSTCVLMLVCSSSRRSSAFQILICINWNSSSCGKTPAAHPINSDIRDSCFWNSASLQTRNMTG